jgi:hypothetical protein
MPVVAVTAMKGQVSASAASFSGKLWFSTVEKKNSGTAHPTGPPWAMSTPIARGQRKAAPASPSSTGISIRWNAVICGGSLRSSPPASAAKKDATSATSTTDAHPMTR